MGLADKCQSSICRASRKVVTPKAMMTCIFNYKVYCKHCGTFHPRNPEVDLMGKPQYCPCCKKRCRLGPRQGDKGKEKYRKRRAGVLIQQTIENIGSDDTIQWLVPNPIRIFSRLLA